MLTFQSLQQFYKKVNKKHTSCCLETLTFWFFFLSWLTTCFILIVHYLSNYILHCTLTFRNALCCTTFSLSLENNLMALSTFTSSLFLSSLLINLKYYFLTRCLRNKSVLTKILSKTQHKDKCALAIWKIGSFMCLICAQFCINKYFSCFQKLSSKTLSKHVECSHVATWHCHNASSTLSVNQWNF